MSTLNFDAVAFVALVVAFVVVIAAWFVREVRKVHDTEVEARGRVHQERATVTRLHPRTGDVINLGTRSHQVASGLRHTGVGETDTSWDLLRRIAPDVPEARPTDYQIMRVAPRPFDNGAA